MKKAFLFFIIPSILLTFTCTQKSNNVNQKKLVIDRWLELWNTGNLALADVVFTSDFVSHIPHFPQVTDLETYREEVVRTDTDIEGFHATLEDVVVDGNKAAGRFIATGKARGELMGMPVDTSQYTNTWIVIYHFTDGKIAEEWWEFDLLGVMQQLGAIPLSSQGPPALQRSAPQDFVWSAPSNKTGNPGNPEANKALVQKEYIAWNQRNVDTLLTVLDEIYSPDFVYHDPARPQITDLASYKKWAVDEVLKPFPDLTMPVDDIFAQGDKVVVRWTFTGTYIVFGKPVTQTGTSIYRIANGKIVEAWCDFDMLGTVQQIKAMSER
jgi:predicted ester cyclase